METIQTPFLPIDTAETLKKLGVFYKHNATKNGKEWKRANNNNKFEHKKPDLKIIVTNFRGVMNCRELLSILVDKIDPDIIIGTETWLHPGIKNSEFLPDGFDAPHRRDRKENSWGGSLIAVKKGIPNEEIKSEENSECIFCKIKPNPKQTLIIGSIYRKPDNNVEKGAKICEIMDRIVSNNKNADFLIGGDFNLPDINWGTETIRRHQYKKDINEAFLSTTLDLGLHQMVKENTRSET